MPIMPYSLLRRAFSHLWMAAIACAIALILLPQLAAAQGGKVYLNPELSLALTCGGDHSKALHLDAGNPSAMAALELRGGYFLNPHLSLFTGFGFASCHYHNIAAPIGAGPDTIREQTQDWFTIPVGIRYATYYGRRSFKTRYYGAAGFRACLLNDARFDYKTADGAASGSNEVRASDFNALFLRWFIEGGLDIPMDYDSAILVGLSLSGGASRNASAGGALATSNYGVLAVGLSVGLRFGL